MKKRLLARLLHLLFLLNLGILFRRLFKKEITVLAYHRIGNSGSDSQYKYDKGLISASVAAFDTQLNFLKKYYDVVDLATLDQRIESRCLNGRELVITFDDGFADNYEQAFPLLQKHGLSAVFFVSTGYIGKPATFWFNDVVCAINSAESLEFTLGDQRLSFAPTVENREYCIGKALSYLKQTPNQQRLHALETLFEQLRHDASQAPTSELPMSWDNLREMQAGGMEIGSHSVSHPILSRLEQQQLRGEIFESRATIERELNADCISIAYPVGGEDEFNEQVEKLCGEAGYKLGLSYISGVNSAAVDNRYNLKRLHVEDFIKFPEFKLMLCLPELYSR